MSVVATLAVCAQMFVGEGSVDLQTYALPSNYQELTAQAKQALLIHNILANPYIVKPPLSEGAPGVGQILFSGIRNAFTSPTDEIAAGRTKVIHKWGVAGGIQFVAANSTPFTGIFGSGALGVVRMSLALPFDSGGSFTPGLALKFLVDGKPSKNIVVMEKLEGQGRDTNYFKAAFTNVLPDPKKIATIAGTWMFEVFVENAIHLGLEHVAAMHTDGSPVISPKAPFQIIMRPGPGLAISSQSEDFRAEIEQLPEGTLLYEVYGKASNEPGSPLIRMGEIRSTTPFVASRYGDESLYFQHEGGVLRGSWSIWRILHGPRGVF